MVSLAQLHTLLVWMAKIWDRVARGLRITAIMLGTYILFFFLIFKFYLFLYTGNIHSLSVVKNMGHV